jgi:hypothetical protein
MAGAFAYRAAAHLGPKAMNSLRSRMRRADRGRAGMHWLLNTRNKPALLWAVIAHAPLPARVSFEGSLKEFHFHELEGASFDETPVLHRHTISPRQDFVVVPISPGLLTTLQARLSGPGVFREGGALVHVQVECNGRLAFGAYDQFHKDCVVAYAPFDEAFLDQLHRQGVLRSYERANK